MRNLYRSRPLAATTSERQHPFQALQSELDRAIGSFYNVFDVPSFNLANFENLLIQPSIDIVEDNENFKIEAEMPGMGEEDIKVSINDGMLTIKGEKEVSKKNTGKNYLKREITYGSYERSIALPDTLDVDKAKASFKKGMLWVTIPKKAEISKKNRELAVEKVKE